MPFRIIFSESAKQSWESLRDDENLIRKRDRVRKALGFLETNPRHPGLRVHRYQSKSGPGGEQIWEAYVENQTPKAWRIWFWYGPGREVITVLSIGPHPD